MHATKKIFVGFMGILFSLLFYLPVGYSLKAADCEAFKKVFNNIALCQENNNSEGVLIYWNSPDECIQEFQNAREDGRVIGQQKQQEALARAIQYCEWRRCKSDSDCFQSVKCRKLGNEVEGYCASAHCIRNQIEEKVYYGAQCG